LLDNFVLWGASVSESEGYYYSHTLQASGFPFLGVIAHIDGQKQLVMRLEGDLTEEVLLSKLHDCVENVGPTLIAARVEAEARSTNERLREEQDRAFQEAQQRDRERLMERRRAEEAERQAKAAEEEARRREEEQERLEELRRQEEITRIEMVRAAKLSLVEEEPAAGPEVSTLRITLFDGSNVTRRFHLDDKMQVVHDFITAQQLWNGQEFELTTNPVRFLALDNTVRDEGLFPRAVVIAKEVEEES
jgi:FAS-associated factor 2